jgi:hypothetical protein
MDLLDKSMIWSSVAEDFTMFIFGVSFNIFGLQLIESLANCG